MFADNRTHGAASGGQISYTNDMKVKQMWTVYFKLCSVTGIA